MFKFCRITLVVVMLCLSVTVQASVSSTIARYIHQTNPNVNVGIDVRSLKSGNIIYQRNANRLYTPGSNLKVLTAVAALLYMGPQYHFVTRLYTNTRRVRGGVLQGSLYLDYSGDPTFLIRDLQRMFSAVKKMGVKQISGNVYVDWVGFDKGYLGNGWTKGDYQYCFSAPVSSIILNRNCLPYVVRPGRSVGQRVRATPAISQFSYMHFSNKTKTGVSYRGCVFNSHVLSNNTIALRGCLSRTSKVLGFSNSVMSVWLNNVAAVKSVLAKNGIQLKGQVVSGRVIPGLRLVAEHQSSAMSTIVRTMLKRSDNLYAESIFKKIGQRYYRGQGSWSSGSKAVRAILQKELSVNLSGAVISDGSGLSHYNLLTPAQLVKILSGAYETFPVNKRFLAALPISGTDGTLKYRMTGRSIRGKVRAKTGSLNGVSTLSGYVKTRRMGTLVFSIMINGFSGPLTKYRQLQDRIVTYLSTL